MKRSFLTGLGITDSDTIKQIIDFHQSVVQDLKDDLTAVRTDLKTAQTDLKTANKTIEDLKNQEPDTDDVEAYKQKLEDLQSKYDTDIAAKQKEYDDFKASTESEKILSKKREAARNHLIKKGFKADVVDDFMLDKIDYDAMKIDGDEVKDKDNYFKPYEEKYAKYLGTTETRGAGVATPPANTGGEKNPWKKESRNLAEQTRIYKEDPAKAREMAKAAGIILN